MIWTGIFWYSTLLVIISIIGRFFDFANTTWQQNSLAYKIQDTFDALLVTFGLIGLFGLAFNESYFDQFIWQLYFLFNIVYLAGLYWTPKFTEMRGVYSNVSVFKAVTSNTLLMAPSHIGQFYYAFMRDWA